MANNTLCTKWGILSDWFDLRLLDAESDAYKHFKPVLGTLARAVARCEVVKYTACRNGDCAVKKSVKCREVCQYHMDGGWKKAAAMTDKQLWPKNWKNCRTDLCKAPYGAIACNAIAMMA